MKRVAKAAVVALAAGLFVVVFFYAPLVPMNIVPCLSNGHGDASPSYYLFTHGEVLLQGHWFWMDTSDAGCK